MNNILSLKIGTGFKNAFLQSGFCRRGKIFSPLHSHNYSEIHAVADGEIQLFSGGCQYTLSKGDIVLIPPKTFHQISSAEASAVHIAFQLEYSVKKLNISHISPSVLSELAREIGNAALSDNYLVVSSYLSLLCCKLLENEKETVTPVSDYAFLIYEFFSEHYNEDISVSDLARELKLSEKQTQRLVKKYTGCTFRQFLTKKRMQAADMLFGVSELSKSDVSKKIGYLSYGGFAKAYKKHTE